MKPATESMAVKARAATIVEMRDQGDEVEAAHTAYKILRAAYLREGHEVFHRRMKELRRQA